MNKNNFIQPVLFEPWEPEFEPDPDIANGIFDDVIKKFFAANPLSENEKEVMYDYKQIM
jgi:hypothetical protein